MALQDKVHIARRYQRSIRIDADLKKASALDGYVRTQSTTDLLLHLSNHVAETKQGAFTWTGPYGSGKSSLAVVLGTLLGPRNKLRQRAVDIVGTKLADAVWEALPPKSRGWKVVPVVGRREDPVQVFGDAFLEAGVAGKPPSGWTDSSLMQTVTEFIDSNSRSAGGLILIVDEMGKFLEAAAQRDTDVYVFQQLAELASRSDGRFILISVLHQAFEEYASRLSRDVRDEWSKIQGRFEDLMVNVAGEEQLELLARAIETGKAPSDHVTLSANVADEVRLARPGISSNFEDLLAGCWPLHPVVSMLLGPISRRRFGQNQRSIFGFLNSAELGAFQDFLRNADEDQVYEPASLWDYLHANLEPSILASPDGHRWAMAIEAIEKCESLGGNGLHLKLLKCIALIDLFKERSGLLASHNALALCCIGYTKKRLTKAIKDLEKWSLVIFRKHQNSLAIFAGSDFEIEEAVNEQLADISELDFELLRAIAPLPPVVAKRHYHKTGALNWLEVNIVPLQDAEQRVKNFSPASDAIGQFLLAIPTLREDLETAEDVCRKSARLKSEWRSVIGLSPRSWTAFELARELFALHKVQEERVELAGDAVARREVQARITEVSSQLERELDLSMESAEWYLGKRKPRHLSTTELNGLASEIAGQRFDQIPRIPNELLNRSKPSSNAIAARNALLRHMVTDNGAPALGIEGRPAEWGLFASILEATGLYQKIKGSWGFRSPKKDDDPANLRPAWDATTTHLVNNSDRTVSASELFEVWSQPPYGIKRGLMPVLLVAFLQSCRDKVSLYRQGIFQSEFKELDVEYLIIDSDDLQLRWMDLGHTSRALLSGMAEIVRDLDPNNSLEHLEPIDVARGLIRVYDAIPAWTKRTNRLSSNAISIRSIFKKAKDPNKFLFDDLPEISASKKGSVPDEGLDELISNVRDGLTEIVEAYDATLSRLTDSMLIELQVPNSSPQALTDLRQRAENVRELSGDFQLNAFVTRLSEFEGSRENIEGILGLAIGKPSAHWVDADLDKAAIEVADLAQRFNRTEAFARVKGRPDKRQAMAVVVGLDGRPAPFVREFDVAPSKQMDVELLVKRLDTLLQTLPINEDHDIVLAALAKLSAGYMTPIQTKPNLQNKKRKKAS